INTNKSALACDCTLDTSQAPGWDITCFSELPSPQNSDSNQPVSDYVFYDYLPTAFTIKYVAGRFLEINCDQSAPNFRPAMFQGKQQQIQHFKQQQIQHFENRECT